MAKKQKVEPAPVLVAQGHIAPPIDPSKALAMYANSRRLKILTAEEGKAVLAILDKVGKKHMTRPLGYGTHFIIDRLEFVTEA
jgi:hypothetical protein